MTFYKICHEDHPTSKLPSILWNERGDKPQFHFSATNTRTVLAYETEDPEMIDMLTSAGYLTKEQLPPGLGNIGPAILPPEWEES